MKKAKIMLTAVAVFAVVGGALAFKARTFGGLFIYTIDNCYRGGGQCCIYEGTQIFPVPNGFDFTSVYTTNVNPEFYATVDLAFCTNEVTGLVE